MRRYYDPPEPPPECPGCGEAYMDVDDFNRTAVCSEGCGWHAEYDWDAEAERRAEARWDDAP